MKTIQYSQYQQPLDQLAGIISHIQELLKNNVSPSEIAIISSKHKTLAWIIPALEYFKIPYSYEKTTNILDNEYITQVLCMVEFVESIGNGFSKPKDDLLVTILKYPFWEIDFISIWELSIQCYKLKISWFEGVLSDELAFSVKNDKEKIKKIIKFLIAVSVDAGYSPAQRIIDVLIGNTGIIIDKDIAIQSYEESQEFFSPFKEYYFDKTIHSQLNNPLDQPKNNNYSTLITGLSTLYKSMNSQKTEKVFLIKDLIEYINLAKENNFPLRSISTIGSQNQAINLLSAHKSKGLEFDCVFIINTHSGEWVEGGRVNNLRIPKNLPINKNSQDLDDKIRLFFVAITRAKKHLHLFSNQFLDSGKESKDIPFAVIEWTKVDPIEQIRTIINEIYSTQVSQYHINPTHNQILEPMVENYQLSATNLINYLNVEKGGPLYFVDNNLIHFPQAKSKHASYGTAIHGAIKSMYREFNKTKSLPNLDYVISEFISLMKMQVLNQKEFDEMVDIGIKKLTLYYSQRKSDFFITDIIERDFRMYDVRVGDARITGQIDKMRIDSTSNQIIVTDFKTGSSVTKWNNSKDATKLWKYNLQLVFYKILIERSSVYSAKYTVSEGRIEFVADSKKTDVIVLPKFYEEEEIKTTELLIQTVYSKIINLDFPDTSHYPPNQKGIEEFCDDLINQKI